MPNQPPGGGQGGFSADHSAKDPLPILVAPTTNGKGKNTIRMEIIPVGCWRLDDVRFEFGASFVLPETRTEFDELDALIKRHPKAPLSVFGHADPVGKNEFNKLLSGRRAEAIYSILVRDADRWENLYQQGGCEEGWGMRSIQHMLTALGYDPGPVDGDQGDKTTAAIQSFQRNSPGLTEDGAAGAGTREKLFLAYMDYLFAVKLEKIEFLNQGRDAGGKGDFQGCGELNPAMVFSQEEYDYFNQPANHIVRDEENAINRRVLILLFRPGTPPVDKWPCPRAAEGSEGCKARKWSDGDQRRAPQALRRKFSDTLDTFGCRFYHRLTHSSPCEGVVPKIVWSWIEFSLSDYPFFTNADDLQPLQGAPQDQAAMKAWPGRQAGAPRGLEQFEAKLTDGKKSGLLDDKGHKRFDTIPAGQCQIRFPDYYKSADDFFGPPCKWPKPKRLRKLRLVRVSPWFAPGPEKLNVVYDIAGCAGEKVELTIKSSRDATTLLIQRDLTDAEKLDGDRKELEVDGIGAAGPLQAKYLDPAHSPYQVTLALADGRSATTKVTEVAVERIQVGVIAPEGRVFMNDPEYKVPVRATIFLKSKAGEGVVTPVEMGVTFTFVPGAANIAAAGSHKYSYKSPGRWLGKKGAIDAKYWTKRKGWEITSTDDFKSSAEVTTGKGKDLGVAKLYFLPSGIGGNTYWVKATAAGVSGKSLKLTVWRKIVVKGREMSDCDHISRNATTDAIQDFFADGTFVQYELAGDVQKLDPRFTVRFIGLWDSASQKELDWEDFSKKRDGEKFSKGLVAASTSPSTVVREAAREEVKRKLNLWKGRIARAYLQGIKDWTKDANIPADAVVGIHFLHPKMIEFAESITKEWVEFPWLTIPELSNHPHPDQAWQSVAGLNHKKVTYIIADPDSRMCRFTIAHEVTHHSENQFLRERFGRDDDHSPTAGLMHVTDNEHPFTPREKKILRGELP